MKYLIIIIAFCIFKNYCIAQKINWKLVDSLNNDLPKGVKLFFTNDSLDGKPNIAYYLEADVNNKKLLFDVDTTFNRRLTPTQFYQKNNHPIVVVNGTFFSFTTNQNLNVAIHNSKLVSYNLKTLQRKNADSVLINIPINRSAIGINKKRNVDIAYIKTDSTKKMARAAQSIWKYNKDNKRTIWSAPFKKWKMKTAIGGGPVVVQHGEINITNEEELMFTGKAILDKHPRTAMGYTKDKKLIILVVQGRFPNVADGITLFQEAKIFKDLGCIEALNLDGGGSSCMLVNGKQTITPSDKTGQRAVPAVFIIYAKQ